MKNNNNFEYEVGKLYKLSCLMMGQNITVGQTD